MGMLDRTALPRMLCVESSGQQMETTAWSDPHPNFVIGKVTVRLVGHGLDMQRTYMTASEAPKVGDYVDIDVSHG